MRLSAIESWNALDYWIWDSQFINNARGLPLLNGSARVTKNFAFSGAKRISVFAEFYNFLNRANFGNQYGTRTDCRGPSADGGFLIGAGCPAGIAEAGAAEAPYGGRAGQYQTQKRKIKEQRIAADAAGEERQRYSAAADQQLEPGSKERRKRSLRSDEGG